MGYVDIVVYNIEGNLSKGTTSSAIREGIPLES